MMARFRHGASFGLVLLGCSTTGRRRRGRSVRRGCWGCFYAGGFFIRRRWSVVSVFTIASPTRMQKVSCMDKRRINGGLQSVHGQSDGRANERGTNGGGKDRPSYSSPTLVSGHI